MNKRSLNGISSGERREEASGQQATERSMESRLKLWKCLSMEGIVVMEIMRNMVQGLESMKNTVEDIMLIVGRSGSHGRRDKLFFSCSLF